VVPASGRRQAGGIGSTSALHGGTCSKEETAIERRKGPWRVPSQGAGSTALFSGGIDSKEETAIRRRKGPWRVRHRWRRLSQLDDQATQHCGDATISSSASIRITLKWSPTGFAYPQQVKLKAEEIWEPSGRPRRVEQVSPSLRRRFAVASPSPGSCKGQETRGEVALLSLSLPPHRGLGVHSQRKACRGSR